MSKTKLIIGLSILMILLIGGTIDIEPTGNERRYTDSDNDNLIIYTQCDDKVVCYWHYSEFKGGMDCFRDTDLINKYCS